MRDGDARKCQVKRTKLNGRGLCGNWMDKLAEGGQFGTKDGHIGRDFRVGT